MSNNTPLDEAMATPLTDEEVETAKKYPATSHGLWVSAEFARDLERQLRDVKQELRQSKAPVIGECEDCGHMLVTPLKRL
jgi:hypothetical protein